jgi:hypothetical protein
VTQHIYTFNRQAAMSFDSSFYVILTSALTDNALQLTVDSVVPISFKLPRADGLKAYFQDDVYLPALDTTAALSTSHFQCHISSGESLPQLQFKSRKPEDMMNLSDKPAEKPVKPKVMLNIPIPTFLTNFIIICLHTKVSEFREQIEMKEAEDKKREEAFNRLQV